MCERNQPNKYWFKTDKYLYKGKKEMRMISTWRDAALMHLIRLQCKYTPKSINLVFVSTVLMIVMVIIFVIVFIMIVIVIIIIIIIVISIIIIVLPWKQVLRATQVEWEETL